MAMTFNGSNQYATVPYVATLDRPTTAITVMGWGYRTGTGTTQTLISRQKSRTAVDEWWNLGYYNQQPRIVCSTSTQAAAAATAPTTSGLNAWSFLCGVWDGTTVTLYVDAVASATATMTGTMVTDNTPVRIGANSNGSSSVTTTEVFQGSLEDLRVYTRALSLEEIRTIHAVRGRDGITDGLLCRYLLDERQAGVAATTTAGLIKDCGPYKLNATATGSPVWAAGQLTTQRRPM